MTRGMWDNEEPEPTFVEFIKFLLNPDIYGYDEHWGPVAIRCR